MPTEMNRDGTLAHWTPRGDGSYLLRLLPGCALTLEPCPGGWSVRLESERISETFATAGEAAQAGTEYARRRLCEALAKVSFPNG
jgi:hypothetical protein